jgi:exonuclease III
MRIIYLCLLVYLCSACVKDPSVLTVLQLNTWGNGGDKIVGVITQTDPDLLFLCEVRAQKSLDYIKDSLKQQGKVYYGNYLNTSSAILSKYPIIEIATAKDLGYKIGAFNKAVIEIEKQRFAVYALHLDYRNYACYMPRGYSGATWKKLPTAIADADTVIKHNRFSKRDEEIKELLRDMDNELAKGSQIIFGGDLNEPSHLDWQKDTKDIRDHNGLVINWDCSIMLHQAGFKDTYRELYPNPLTHPGFTWPAGNKSVSLKSLSWTEGVDDRDRIDFIYYYPNNKLKLKDVVIVGPSEDFYDGKIRSEETEDKRIIPNTIWASDHKGLYAEFEF